MARDVFHADQEVPAAITSHNNDSTGVHGIPDTSDLVTGANDADADWIAPTLTNSWVNFGLGYSTAGYRKDALGRVSLKGIIASGTDTATAFTLPAGYRPGEILSLCGMAAVGYPLVVWIQVNGNVEVTRSAGLWTSLDNISFYAA